MTCDGAKLESDLEATMGRVVALVVWELELKVNKEYYLREPFSYCLLLSLI